MIVREASHSEQHHAKWMSGFFPVVALDFPHRVNGPEFIRAKAIRSYQGKVIKPPVVVIIRRQVEGVAVASGHFSVSDLPENNREFPRLPLMRSSCLPKMPMRFRRAASATGSVCVESGSTEESRAKRMTCGRGCEETRGRRCGVTLKQSARRV